MYVHPYKNVKIKSVHLVYKCLWILMRSSWQKTDSQSCSIQIILTSVEYPGTSCGVIWSVWQTCSDRLLMASWQALLVQPKKQRVKVNFSSHSARIYYEHIKHTVQQSVNTCSWLKESNRLGHCAVTNYYYKLNKLLYIFIYLFYFFYFWNPTFALHYMNK